jgi:hypothetical protein
MESLHVIVGCVATRVDAIDRLDDLSRQVRGHRAAVLARHPQGLTFVRFQAGDAGLVALAVRAVLALQAPALRFAFASGMKADVSDAGDTFELSQRSVQQAQELAAAADDGEVLVTPPLAMLLVESGLSLRERRLRRADGPVLVACGVDVDACPADVLAPDARPPLLTQAGDAMAHAFIGLLARADAAERARDDLQRRLDTTLQTLQQRLERVELQAQGQAETRVADQARELAREQSEKQVENQAEKQAERDRLAIQRVMLNDLRDRLDAVLAASSDAERRVTELQAHRALMDDALARAGEVEHALDDIRVQLEMLSEQRAVIDHVGEQAARLDFAVREAQNTLRALQRERELAERIGADIKARRLGISPA